MFTIRHIRTNIMHSLGLTKGEVKWEKPLDASRPQEIALSQFNNKTVDERNKILADATPEQRNLLLKKIEGLKGGTEANKKWRESMKIEINRLNVLPSLGNPQVLTSPEVAAVQAGVDEINRESQKGQDLSDIQKDENSVVQNQNEAKKEQVKGNTKTVAESSIRVIEKTLAYKDNDPIAIEFENDSLKKESVVDLLSDLDGMAGVERTNRGWFRRTFFGGGDQKEVVGEQQLKLLLSGKSMTEINALYKRVTGDTQGLDITKENLKNDSLSPSSRFDFDHATQSKITKFQIDLIQQVDVVATLSSVLLGDSDARTGLRAVLEEGGVKKLEEALQDKSKVEHFQEVLKQNGVLARDPNFLEKVASVLLRIGVSAGFSVLSGGLLGGYIEQGKLRTEGGRVQKDGLNLTLKKGFGEDGSTSVGASADLIGVRLEANWNDPEMRIANRVAYIMDAEDKKEATNTLVQKINEQAGVAADDTPSEKEDNRRNAIAALGDQFLKAQEKLLALPDSQNRDDAIAQNTLTYLSKVEKAKGTQLKGIFAAANLAGAFVGLSGTRVDTSASSDKLKLGAAIIEGEALGARKLLENEVTEKLAQLEITREENTYIQNGEVLIDVPKGKKVQWKFEEIYTDREIITRATPILVDTNQKAQSVFVSLSRKNIEAKNEYIEKNPQKVSDFMHQLRQTDARTSSLQKAISDGRYEEAEKTLTSILSKNQNSTAKALLAAMNSLKTPVEKTDFFDLLLSKTSGGRMSLELAKKLESGKDVTADIRKYYERISAVFAKQYGISQAQVMEQFNTIAKSGLKKDQAALLGKGLENGFTGVVAFSQLNKGEGFATLDKIINSNARIIGKSNLITDEALATQIREKIKSKITESDVADFKKNNKDLVSKSSEEIKNLMVAGRVSSYLSYEESAQCFNLGFVAEPGRLENTILPQDTDSKESTGTIVGKPEAEIMNGGIGGGVSWKNVTGGNGNGGNNGGNGGSNTTVGTGGGSGAPGVQGANF